MIFFLKSYNSFFLSWYQIIKYFLKDAKASTTQNRYELCNYCEKLRSRVRRESNLQSLTFPLTSRSCPEYISIFIKKCCSWCQVLSFCHYVTDFHLYLEFLKNYVLDDRCFKLLNRVLMCGWLFVSFCTLQLKA